MPIRLSIDEFISRSSKLYNNRYDYSLVHYQNCMSKVKIICPDHGIFEQTPQNHLNGHPCKKCSRNIVSSYQRRGHEFIEKSNLKFDRKYDYSLVNYENRAKKIKIICPDHGVFKQTPINHLSRGCKKCSILKKANINESIFINKSNIIHKDKYDYSLVSYKSDKIKVVIKCKKHGDFLQQPNTHLSGRGCPSCSSSKGENMILNYLSKRGILFEKEKKFERCSNVNNLLFDFYIPNLNTCIEFDGKQHFESINFFGGDDQLNDIKKRDQIKNQYCLDNNINLVRIPYYDINSIDKILDSIWEN